jgi:hypothetical protein
MNSTHLVAIHSDGTKIHFGACEAGKRLLPFRYWFPHLGIAVDTKGPEYLPDTEAKRAWCYARNIIYFAARDLKEDGMMLLRQLADERRGT